MTPLGTERLPLFADPPDPAGVDTPCPIPPSDGRRIQNQLDHTRRLMSNGLFWLLWELAERTGASEAGQSARLRDLRKHPYHFHVERRRLADSPLYQYRLLDRGECTPDCARRYPHIPRFR